MPNILNALFKVMTPQTFTPKIKRRPGIAFIVGRDGIEPPTQGFSVLCSTD